MLRKHKRSISMLLFLAVICALLPNIGTIEAIDTNPDVGPVSITGTKTWENNVAGPTAEVDIILYADGKQVATTTATASGGWTYSFDGLPVYGAEGQIDYTVGEATGANYEMTSVTQPTVAAGQISGTGNVGEMGSNTALAGHRRTFFRNLDKLQPGDEITIETEQGPLYYEIYKMHIVEPTDLSVLNRSQKHSLLTLITCHPLYTSQQRLIVHAYLK